MSKPKIPEKWFSPRKLFIRHGERLDITFNQNGQNWLIQMGADQKGCYRRTLNMPSCLPVRKHGIMAYGTDAPLSEIGYIQTKLVGNSLAVAKMKLPNQIYVSPAYRCIQTGHGILQGLKTKNTKINIEPGLFEWAKWYNPTLPRFMELAELTDLYGNQINLDYKPLPANKINVAEDLEEYYDRSHKLVTKLLEQSNPGETLVLVGHGSTLDACSRRLIGFPPRDEGGLKSIMLQTPYVAMLMIDEQENKPWKLVQPPVPPLTHQGNDSYDWKMLVGAIT